ncbi:MAG: GDSL family lipase [Phycisphaerae bacterium]|nr:GDSL family lipase [Phycisphaerae bacterium]
MRVLFLGDSITQGWESDGKEAWEKHWAPLGAANFGISGDRTQHVLWRLANGNLAGLAAPASGAAPKVVVLMIGTNNSNGEDNTAEEIGAGIGAIVSSLREKLPATRVLVLGIFPRGEKPDSQRQKITKVNAIAARLADGKFVHYLDIGPDFLSADGTISREVMPDFLHLSRKGYDIWSNSIQARVNDLMTAGE